MRSTTLALVLGVSVVIGMSADQQRTTTTPPARQARGSQPRPRLAPRQLGAMSQAEAVLLTNVWALLAEGRAADAVAKAEQIFPSYPRSPAVLIAVIEAHIAQGGTIAGLNRYERWLQQRTIEEPAVLRRLALAMVREEAWQQQDARAQVEAVRALEDEGERAMARTAMQKSGAATRASASLGDKAAVMTLIAQLDARSSDPVRTIDALGNSGNPAAISSILPYLKDERQEVRGAAAEALGKLGNPQVAARIAPLLSDRTAYVRIRAAGALNRLGDSRGLPLLEGLMADESPAMRLAAAEALASRPDATWLLVVRQLTQQPDPEIRASAARLIAPHDPELARSVLESLANDQNPAIRDLAGRGLAEVTTSDMTALRRSLRSAQPLTRVRTAARLLTLTR